MKARSSTKSTRAIASRTLPNEEKFPVVGGDCTVLALELTRDSADVLPPLKSVVGGILNLLTIVERCSLCSERTEHLARRATMVLDLIKKADVRVQQLDADLLQDIRRFEMILHKLSLCLQSTGRRSKLVRMLRLRSNERMLDSLALEFEAAAEALTIRMTAVQTAALGHLADDAQHILLTLASIEQSLEKSDRDISALRRQVRLLQLTTVFLV
ncbi:hypothetical protein MKEN_00414200 [Mycena kentingensis (nom. inval.)]|nr:hypothetical protein MKEN_00414200 [Mycena kentingensis (nom. inval.)]